MMKERVLYVLNYYEDYLSEYEALFAEDISDKRQHLLEMIPKMREFIEEDRMEKVFRWLGFMQGAFWSWGDFYLEDLKNHNRPDFHIY